MRGTLGPLRDERKRKKHGDFRAIWRLRIPKHRKTSMDITWPPRFFLSPSFHSNREPLINNRQALTGRRMISVWSHETQCSEPRSFGRSISRFKLLRSAVKIISLPRNSSSIIYSRFLRGKFSFIITVMGTVIIRPKMVGLFLCFRRWTGSFMSVAHLFTTLGFRKI